MDCKKDQRLYKVLPGIKIHTHYNNHWLVSEFTYLISNELMHSEPHDERRQWQNTICQSEIYVLSNFIFERSKVVLFEIFENKTHWKITQYIVRMLSMPKGTKVVCLVNKSKPLCWLQVMNTMTSNDDNRCIALMHLTWTYVQGWWLITLNYLCIVMITD